MPASIDRKSARDLQDAIDRKESNQPVAVINRDEAVFAVKRGGGCGPVWFCRLQLTAMMPFIAFINGCWSKAAIWITSESCRWSSQSRAILSSGIGRQISHTAELHFPVVSYTSGPEWLKGQYAHSKSAKSRRSEPRRRETPTRRIAMVAFSGRDALDISGPAQVFAAELEAIELPGRAIRCHTCPPLEGWCRPTSA